MVTLLISLLSILLTFTAVVFAWRLHLAFKRFRIRKQYSAAVEAPSVTVCIAARNEAQSMTRCLESVLASDYRKMEVIVYDDNSNDNTSTLIKAFAHAGVRFIPGKKLPTGWLGKNHALDVLAREASGTYVLFLDTDTTIRPQTISHLVGYVTSEKLDMVSVLPMFSGRLQARVLFAPLRMFWQLVLANKTRPATSHALWMISRSTLFDELGGFTSVQAQIMPESRLAGRLQLARAHTLLSDTLLGIIYDKPWKLQVNSAQRLLYPLVGGSAFYAVRFFALLMVLNMPIVALVAGIYFELPILSLAALWFMLLFIAMYALFASHMWRSLWWLGGLLWPLLILQETVLFLYSIYGYATKTITWKGRAIYAPHDVSSDVVRSQS